MRVTVGVLFSVCVCVCVCVCLLQCFLPLSFILHHKKDTSDLCTTLTQKGVIFKTALFMMLFAISTEVAIIYFYTFEHAHMESWCLFSL